MKARYCILALAFVAALTVGPWITRAAETTATEESGAAALVSFSGPVEVLRAGTQAWQPAQTNQILQAGDHVRTGEGGRAMLRLSNKLVVRVPSNTTQAIEVNAAGENMINLESGDAYLNSREVAGRIPMRTRLMSAAIRGTEFHVHADAATGRTVLTLLDGEVDLTNELGRLTLHSGEQATVEPGTEPKRTAVLEAANVIQWFLYYPAVVQPDDLGLSADETNRLRASLAAYRAGDLLQASALYAPAAAPSGAERIYRAALWLAIGEVTRAGQALGDSHAPVAEALRRMMVVVQQPAAVTATQPATATEWMVESYAAQAASHLEAALAAARQATELAPDFGFAWSRVAELEFSFAHRAAADAALEKALTLAPRHAPAWALRGFVFAAANQNAAARAAFNQSIALDGALPDAWLGRGLMSIHAGRVAEGRSDLQVAAALQPNRAVLRSYLGKAFAEEGNRKLAEKDLDLAQRLDPRDPTAPLYSALLKQSENRVNEAVRDLERSVELNDNRSVYRSAQLLDQDRAVRSANLANIYLDAGLTEVSVREAARAVSYDYANYSAHLFLANSYDRLRDPKQINLRYETPAIGEYLIANLLAPVGAGTLSQNVSQQEYSKLFERDGFGVVNSTEYSDNGDWVQNATTHGRFGNSAYAVDVSYRNDNGSRPNNDFEETTVSIQLKQQLTPDDSVYLQAITYDSNSGDTAQYYNPSQASRQARTSETQEPILIAGYHHEWGPGVHTLLLASRADDTLKYRNPDSDYLLVEKDPSGATRSADVSSGLANHYRSQLEIYSVELQQIFQTARHTTIAGTLYQNGDFDTHSQQHVSPNGPDTADDIDPGFERISVYGYHYWQIHPSLLLVAGLSYDHLDFPVNYRYAPLADGEESNDQVSPKGGIIWTPRPGSTLRAAYTRSLGGASFDQSLRLEPTQVAGFNQAFRSLIPESIAGANANADFETYGISLEQKFPTATYLGVGVEALNSEVARTLGSFQINDSPPAVRSQAREKLDFEERTLVVTVNQLLGERWALGTRYELSHARLEDDYTSIPSATPSSTGFSPRNTTGALLHSLALFAIYNHPSGFFARGEAVWRTQENDGYAPPLSGDDFWQFNIFAGYRFWHRHAEIQLGLLNLTDQDYHLNPLNLYYEAPHERTFTARLQFNF